MVQEAYILYRTVSSNDLKRSQKRSVQGGWKKASKCGGIGFKRRTEWLTKVNTPEMSRERYTVTTIRLVSRRALVPSENGFSGGWRK